MCCACGGSKYGSESIASSCLLCFVHARSIAPSAHVGNLAQCQQKSRLPNPATTSTNKRGKHHLQITMRKSKKRSARAAENDYDSDGGFVVGSDGDGNIPLAKRVKTTVAGGKEGADWRQKQKPGKREAVGSADIDDNGDMFWEVVTSG